MWRSWGVAVVWPVLLLGQGELIEGTPASPVKVVIYEDLQCPDCAAFRRMLDDSLLGQYGAKVAFVHKDFPLPKHSWARKAAMAARWFALQKPETGVEFRRYIMARIKQTPDTEVAARVSEFARQHGLDGARAVAAMTDEKLEALVEKDYQEGIARGVSKTPTVFVDGKPFIETFTVEEISRAIEKAIAGS